jgi:hypothetical protein
MSWELRDVIILDYITSLRPYGEKIKDFFLTSLDCTNYAVKHVVNYLKKCKPNSAGI